MGCRNALVEADQNHNSELRLETIGAFMTLDEKVVDLERQIKDLAAIKAWSRLKSNFWQWFAVATSLLFVVLFAGLYLHSAGFINLTTTAPPSGILPSATKTSGDFRDLLTILVPMFAAGVAFVVSAAGMRRLQSYDDELARARQERRDDEKSMRKETAESAAALRKETSDSAATMRSEIGTISDKLQLQFKGEREAFIAEVQGRTKAAIDTEFESMKDDVANLTKNANQAGEEHARKLLSGVTEMETRLQADFGYLKGKDLLSPFAKDSNVSVAALHTELTALLQSGKPTSKRIAIETIEAALANPERMFGSPDDWFNLSAQLGRSDMELQALRVCTTALARFDDPGNTAHEPNQDLLAHAIQFSSALGLWAECEKLLTQADKIGRARWGWRLFVFVGGHFQNRANEAKFLQLNEDFANYLPYSEQAFSQLASYWNKAGKVDKALDAIERGLSKPGIRGERLLMRKSEILLELSRYQEAIDATTQALAATATDQPGSAQWAIMFHRACAYDALMWQLVDDQKLGSKGDPLTESQKSDIKHLASSAIASYRAATEEFAISLTLKVQGATRIRLIRNFCDLNNLHLSGNTASASSTTTEVPKDITPGQARSLVAQLVEQLAKLPEEKWWLMRGELAQRLKSDFNARSIAAVVSALRRAAHDTPAGGDMLRELADLLDSDPSPDDA
jgi:tetratricopeptide (TPR) repeat protein